MGNSCAIDMQLTFEVSPSLIYGDAIQVGGKQANGLDTPAGWRPGQYRPAQAEEQEQVEVAEVEVDAVATG